MTLRFAPAPALVVPLGGASAYARHLTPSNLPVSYLAGGGPAVDDCLASVELYYRGPEAPVACP